MLLQNTKHSNSLTMAYDFFPIVSLHFFAFFDFYYRFCTLKFWPSNVEFGNFGLDCSSGQNLYEITVLIYHDTIRTWIDTTIFEKNQYEILRAK